MTTMIKMRDGEKNLEAGFSRLMEEYRPRLRGFIRSVVGNKADADEIFQETCLVLWKKFDRYETGTNFMAWAIRVARFEVLRHQEKTRRNILRNSEQFIDAVATGTVANTERLSGLRETLLECTKKLSDKQRDLVEQHYLAGVSVRELSTSLNRPASTIYNRLRRIRQLLAECVMRSQGRRHIS